jgi:prepilin-type N-terminal cleavage/methylation domain-containing protein/prepilin-type processing-associated H-X9-DG protein
MKPHRCAFTLVELLVVITVIAILISLMLAGVQATRESGRRAQCQSNLSRLGVALENYESAKGVLPPGTTEPKGPIHSLPQGNHISWLVHLLPYVDENVTFRHVDLAAGSYDRKNAPVAAVRIGLFVCPTEKSLGPSSSYAGCHHDVESPIDEGNRGVFFRNSRVKLKDVTDGLAHTLFVGEKRVPFDDLGWMSGTRATLRNTGTPINQTKEEKAGELAVGGFASSHADGANFLWGDGAVRFLGQGIAKDVFQLYGDRADGKLIAAGPTRQP